MKLEFIRISELFGSPADEKRLSALASELSTVEAIKKEVQGANKKKNISKRAESLAGLFLLSRAANLSGVYVKRNQKGRPFADGGDFDFNISHSGDLAACAVSNVGCVGLDVEEIRTLPDRDKLAKRYFCEEEINYILSAFDRDEAFFRIWTRKEAYLKFTGDGFFGDIKSVNTLSGDVTFVEKILVFGESRYIASVTDGKPVTKNFI